MKKILLLFFILLINHIYGQNFPYDKPELLIGKIVTVDDSELYKKIDYHNFIKKFNKSKRTYSKFNNKPFVKNVVKSDYNKLVDKEFTVVNVFKLDEIDKYILELNNNEIGTLFYEYNSKYESSFELIVKDGLNLPEGFLCNQITIDKDKFEDITRYSIPFNPEEIYLLKIIFNNQTKLFLDIKVKGNTLNIGEKGVFILLENGEKIIRQNESIDVESYVNRYSSGWKYSTIIELNEEEIESLKKFKITDVRLYIYDETISKETAYKIQEFLKCMTK